MKNAGLTYGSDTLKFLAKLNGFPCERIILFNYFNRFLLTIGGDEH
jgi:hypothetical protein